MLHILMTREDCEYVLVRKERTDAVLSIDAARDVHIPLDVFFLHDTTMNDLRTPSMYIRRCILAINEDEAVLERCALVQKKAHRNGVA